MRISRYGWVVLALGAMACSGGSGGLGMSCGGSAPASAPVPATPSTSPHMSIGQLPIVDIDGVLTHTKKLSSDQFEGRAPGTRGEELTVRYLAEQFQAAGLKPGNTDGSYFQPVPLVGITPTPAPLVFRKGGQAQTLKWKDDVVAWTKHVADSASIQDSELVFVGYGVVAPEFDWDDYKGVDVNGKTQLIVNGSENVVAYDPRSGEELWRVNGPGGFIVHTPVFGQGMMIASVGYPAKKVIGIRLSPKEGEERIAWTYEKGTSYVPSPLLYGEYLYLMTDSGLLTCLDARTGEPKYEAKRFPKPGTFAGAPIAFEGKLLITSRDGDTYVVKAGPVHEILGTNALGENVYSSLAVAGDSVYIRSDKNLYRIREAKKN
jgi:hypothetical protein